MRGRYSEVPSLLQFKIAPEIGSLGTKFSDLGLCFLENQPKIPPFLPPSGQQRLPPRIQAGSRPGAAARVAAPLLRAAVRGCARWRVVARSAALAPAGGAKEERESLSGRRKGWMDLGFGREKFYREERKLSLSSERKYLGGTFE